MARTSPLQRLHRQAEAHIAVYGPSPASPDAPIEATREAVEVVESYGELEIEYAAIRKACILVDQPHRGLIEVTGADRLEFLNRMLTQELKGMRAGEVRRSFWLNRKGRIDADFRVIELGDRTLLECDVHAVERALATLGAFVITEDVTLTDLTARQHCLGLHGPTAAALISASCGLAALSELAIGRVEAVSIGGSDAVLFRHDTTGEFGVELWVPVDAARAVFERLLELGHAHDDQPGPGSNVRVRPAGWHAWNIARIEAGIPLFNLDFGTESLPAETGVLHDRVSFTKGCYLGQEVVARMHARGHPKQTLVAIKFESVLSQREQAEASGFALPVQPATGAGLSLAGVVKGGAEGAHDEAVGVITSSTLGPMVSSSPIAFAQVKYAHSAAGTQVKAEAEGLEVVGSIQPQLRFLADRS
jgi:tRNA-modifying protein YgfZ